MVDPDRMIKLILLFLFIFSSVVAATLSLVPVISSSQQNRGLVCLSQLSNLGSRRSVRELDPTSSGQTNSCHFTQSDDVIQPDSKRRKPTPAENMCEDLKSCVGSVFCMLKLPQFRHQTDFKCHLVVDWMESLTSDDLDNKSPGSLGRHNINCGVISLSVDDVLREKYHVKISEIVHNDRGRFKST